MLTNLQKNCLDAMELPHGISTPTKFAFIAVTPTHPQQTKTVTKKAPIREAIVTKKAPAIKTKVTPQATPQQTEFKPINTDNLKDWGSLNTSIQNCHHCIELTQSRSQSIAGYGHSQAELLIVEEAPSSDEDLQGKPFVGTSGLLFDNMLKAIQIDRETVYTTNIIKCLTPNNRDPHNEEVQNCLQFLHAQINCIKPKLILALGRIAAHHLLSVKTPVRQLRGALHTHSSSLTPVIVSYHPTYLLRNLHYKQQAWEDLKRVYSYLNT